MRGTTSAEFDEQITDLQPFRAQHWRARDQARRRQSGSTKAGRPHPLPRGPALPAGQRHPPARGAAQADFDLVIASQPYRARASTAFKAKKVIAPCSPARSAGRAPDRHPQPGNDPGMEIVHKVWPDEHPFHTDRHALLAATRDELGQIGAAAQLQRLFVSRSIFRYEMHTLPNEIAEASSSSIGTSTLFAARNDAACMAQIEDQRLEAAMKDGPTSTQPARCCSGTRGYGSTTNPTSSLASGIAPDRAVHLAEFRMRCLRIFLLKCEATGYVKDKRPAPARPVRGTHVRQP